MTKIINALLEAKFTGMNVPALLEIINATPNPSIATEILCGLYEEPVINPTKVEKDGSVKTFKSYDKWNDKVTYSYLRAETKSAYFPSNVNKEDINMENFNSLKAESSANNARWLSIPTGAEIADTSYCSLSNWQ